MADPRADEAGMPRFPADAPVVGAMAEGSLVGIPVVAGMAVTVAVEVMVVAAAMVAAVTVDTVDKQIFPVCQA